MIGRHIASILLLLVCWARVAVADDPPKQAPPPPTTPAPTTPADGDKPKTNDPNAPTPNAPTPNTPTPNAPTPNAPTPNTPTPNTPTPTDPNAPTTNAPANDPNAPATNDPNAPTTKPPTTNAKTSPAPAAPTGPTVVTGKVTDVLGRPVPNARVYVMPRRGQPIQTKTGKDGRYSVKLKSNGTHGVVIAIDKAHTFRTVLVVDGISNTMDVDIELDVEGGEVIKIEDKRRPEPKVRPKPKQDVAKSLPYSEEAVERDAWARAWLLLDVDERGTVTRLKLLKRPGFDLDKICIDEAFKLKFTPALDDAGRPMKTYMLWTFEWPSWGWLIQGNGTAMRRPVDRDDMEARQTNSLVTGTQGGAKIGGTWATPTTAESAGTAFETSLGRVPCAGSGPLNLDLRNRAYRDCSQPDTSVAEALPWITRETAAAAVAELANPNLILVEEKQGSRVPTFVGLGVTSVLAVTAIVSFYKFSKAVDRVEDYAWQASIDPEAYARHTAARDRWGKRAFGFTAGAILSGGATLLIWHRNMPKRSFSVQPSETGNGASASFSTTW
ncbi:MAG: carboxypeptidase regulatory-like domain-containing protein [Myxococcota bacterium]|nr:carboxypeptidase regulatory-like domain-containing protein [Myxococcota bacterium]